MKNTILLMVLLSTFFSISAQKKIYPVHWSAQVKPIDATTYDIVFTADLDTEWELYSQFQESKDGPLPTTFMFQMNDNYKKIGAVKESWKNKKKVYDEMFEMVVIKYEKSAVFTQRVQVTATQNTKNAENAEKILVTIEYMTCRATSCLPARYVELNIDLATTSIQKPFNVVD